MIYIKQTEKYGRGLYALTDIDANKVLCRCEVLVLSARDTVFVNETALQFYTFVYNKETGEDCLVLGNGELFNHDDTPNVGYRLEEYDGRKVMVFFTLTEVKKDEQLFINYGADTKVNTDKYTVNL